LKKYKRGSGISSTSSFIVFLYFISGFIFLMEENSPPSRFPLFGRLNYIGNPVDKGFAAGRIFRKKFERYQDGMI